MKKWNAKTRNDAFAKLAECWRDTGLSPAASVVLGAVLSYTSPTSPLSWPSVRELSTDTLPRSTVQDAIEELVEARFMERNPEGKWDLTGILRLGDDIEWTRKVRRLGFKNPRRIRHLIGDDLWLDDVDHERKLNLLRNMRKNGTPESIQKTFEEQAESDAKVRAEQEAQRAAAQAENAIA